MIAHSVSFTWKEGTTQADIDSISAALDTLPAAIPVVLHYVHGRDLGLRQGNADYAVFAIFDGDDPAAYLDHPAHVKVAAETVTRFVAQKNSVQMGIDWAHFSAPSSGSSK